MCMTNVWYRGDVLFYAITHDWGLCRIPIKWALFMEALNKTDDAECTQQR